jgi:hypothetical protein
MSVGSCKLAKLAVSCPAKDHIIHAEGGVAKGRIHAAKQKLKSVLFEQSLLSTKLTPGLKRTLTMTHHHLSDRQPHMIGMMGIMFA